jgi:MinD-like ATPase involved in chromosome partitioning or flagellar assembly
MHFCEHKRVTDLGAREDCETEVTLEIPALPRITAHFSGDYSGELSIDGVSESFAADSQEQLREVILSRVSRVAVELGRPVKVTTKDDEGAWLLVVHANGEIGGEERVPDEPAIEENPFASLISLPSHPATRANPTLPSHPETRPNPSLQIEAEPEPAPLAGRRSFLTEERRKADRAKKGWRGFIAKTGLPIAASTKERIEREETHAVSQHWPGPRTIAIVNGKGGANKTPTTAILAAVFARNGGSGVLAWDNNETRGTLGWRTEQGLHDATVQTLLPNTEHLLSPAAQSSDLSHFVHHQTGDKYDVLRSNPTMLATQQRISSDDFDNLHSIAAKYFRLIFIDSGNDESAERWLRMIDHTDQLVIATTALGEHAEAGALLLEALSQRDEASARLASQAVVVVSQSEKAGAADDARKVAAGFKPLARQAVSVPFDPAIHGGRLEYTALSSASRRAWLHAAAVVAEGL